MDQALSRTRRNMIGVSVILSFIYSFGWDFPSSVRILGNTLTANPNFIRSLAWAAFVYLVYEYNVHVKEHYKAYVGEFRSNFANNVKSKIEAKIHREYDEEKLRQRLLDAGHRGHKEDLEIDRVRLKPLGGRRFSQLLHVGFRIRAWDRHHQSKEETPVAYNEKYRANYFRFLGPTLRSHARLMLFESRYFEYLLPLLFPLLAIASLLFGPFEVLSEAP